MNQTQLQRARLGPDEEGHVQVNARLGGGPVALMNQLVWGVDLVEEQFLASAGIPSRPYIAKRPDKYVAENSVNAKKTGTLENVDFIDVSTPLHQFRGHSIRCQDVWDKAYTCCCP